MNVASFFGAMIVAGLMTLDWAEPRWPQPGDLTVTPEGCMIDRDGDVVDGPGECFKIEDDDEEIDTCAECRTDGECEALCPEE